MSETLKQMKREFADDFKDGFFTIKPHGVETDSPSFKGSFTYPKKINKYQRKVPSTTIDVYDVLEAFEVTNSATAHAVKKLLASGQRGYKGVVQDLKEAIASIERAIELEEAKQP